MKDKQVGIVPRSLIGAPSVLPGTASTLFTFLCFFFLFFTQASLASNTTIDLTTSEKQWLKDHPVIRIAPDPNFAPVEWFTLDGHFKGISADFVALIEQRLGIKFEIVHAENWSVLIDMARNRQVDALTAAGTSPQRKKFLSFTSPHIELSGVIISANKDFSSIEDLVGRKVAVVVDYIWDDLLTYHKTDVRLVRVEDTLTGLELTSLGAVDAMVSDLASVTHIISEEGFANLSIVSRLEKKLELGFAVRNDWPVLHSILDKAVASISAEDKKSIMSKWIKLDKRELWDNPTFRYSVFGVLLFIVVTFTGVITWNRMLNKQVVKRTKQLEDAQMQLIQAEKMKSIGRLAAGVAHEVKNPLAIIQMGSDFLSQEVKDNEVAGEVIKDIDDAVHRADTVIRGLLDFSRDEKLSRKPSSINKIIENSLHLVGHEMVQRSIDVEAELADDLPDIPLDENKLKQVFINLLMNSAHAMDRDGKIVVSSRVKALASQLDLSRDRDGMFKIGDTALIVEVVDTGPGISDEDRGKIFDPFYTTKPVGEGTGLGLSVTRNIVNLHEGSIDICNRKEGGASVLLMFKL